MIGFKNVCLAIAVALIVSPIAAMAQQNCPNCRPRYVQNRVIYSSPVVTSSVVTSPNYGSVCTSGNCASGACTSGNCGTGYATGQKVQTVVKGGLFGLRSRVVTQDAGFLGTPKQVVRVTSGIRGQWVWYADGSYQWQWYR